MRVWIEAEYCTGDGLCADLCPEMFDMGDDGLAHVKGCGGTVDDDGPVTVPERLEESVLDAEAQCAGECLHTAS
jgi:ferredoxin